MITDDQMTQCLREIIDEEVGIYKDGPSIQVVNEIPDTTKIPLQQNHWYKIEDVICVYVDMVSSTKLSASKTEKTTAGAYQLFTGTAVRLFNEFKAPYVDVRGDGVFALFNCNQPYRAFAAAVTFKTFADCEFVPRLQSVTDVKVGAHIGIDQKTVLVRKLGLKHVDGRTDRQNEVWAGKPVNMAAKLASGAEINQLLVSDRFFSRIQNELITKSCGCRYETAKRTVGQKVDLWTPVDLTENDQFDFDTGHVLESDWCSVHGKDYCEQIMALDDEE